MSTPKKNWSSILNLNTAEKRTKALIDLGAFDPTLEEIQYAEEVKKKNPLTKKKGDQET